MSDLNEKAARARNKKAALGTDIELEDYISAAPEHGALKDPGQLTDEEKQRLVLAGVDSEERERSGTYLQKDASVLYSGIRQKGVEVLPILEALQRYDWLRDYYWKLVDVAADKYTARTQLQLHNGYFIRSLPGSRGTFPVQSCLYLEKDGFAQQVHNIVIAEEDSELHIITGCATAAHLRKGVHLGVSEFYVGKNASLSFTMVHNWAEEMMVRPRSTAVVEEGGLFLNNYICMKPVRSLQMYPTTRLVGKGATARFYSLLIGSPDSELDVGGRILLQAEETGGEIIARAISNGGNIVARGDICGEVPGVKAHLECRGLILNGGSIHAIPELKGTVDGVELSHEAAVGKIAQEEILYLMSRGLSEDEAVATIVRGFLNVDIPGLPPQLKAEIDRAVELSQEEMM
jgi:Fe-S cluster assembly scaffold protein SufB